MPAVLFHSEAIATVTACVQSGLSTTRTVEEVKELEEALKVLIYRAGGIQKAKGQRHAKAFRSMMDCAGEKRELPMELAGYCQHGVESGFYDYYRDQEREAMKHLTPKARSQVVWADAQFITAEVEQQLPSCIRKASQSHVFCTA